MAFKPISKMMNAKNSHISRLGKYIAYLLKYRNMFEMMVEKDLKGRFKNTILGYFWHLLNPLTHIIIYILLFTMIFGRDIPNYWVYISTGMFAYSFFSACCSTGCNAIIGNSHLVTKMTFAKEVLIFSKVGSSLITLTISYCLLTTLMLITGVGPTIHVLLMPVIITLFAIFCTGLGLLFSAITVYLRDFAHAIGIVLNFMMFAVPIFYVAKQMTNPILEIAWGINPLYYFINCIHDSMYYGIMPTNIELLICTISSIIMMLIGLYVFKKLEKGFAERL